MTSTRSTGNLGQIDAGQARQQGTTTRTSEGRAAVVGSGAGNGVSTAPITRLLVGKARREPGFNFDGTVAEDMLFADTPAKSRSIRSDPVFALNDPTLGAYLRQLMTSLSVGNMETVAVQMQEKFCRGEGGTYSSSILDGEVANHDAFAIYHAHFLTTFERVLRERHFDALAVAADPIPMTLLNFSSLWDKATGLGITIHQVWSVHAELEHYSTNLTTGFWQADLVYTLYDHYRARLGRHRQAW